MALVSKILEATLTAGQTSVTFTDADIPNSILRVYPSNSELIYESITLIGNTLTVTYPAQASNVSIALEITKSGVSVIDNLTSSDALNALSANQGKSLKDSLDTLSDDLSTLSDTVAGLDIPDNITDLDDVNVTSIQDGQVLAWDEDTAKFVNVNQSGGSGVNYSTVEQEIGRWIDNKILYQITISIPTPNANTTYSVSSLNIDSCVDIRGYMSGNGNIPNGYWYSNTNNLSIRYYDGDIFIDAPAQYANSPCIVTIQYTKTS